MDENKKESNTEKFINTFTEQSEADADTIQHYKNKRRQDKEDCIRIPKSSLTQRMIQSIKHIL